MATKDEIIIHPPKKRLMDIELIGETPLIMHKMSEKSKKMIRDKQQKKAKKPREARNPKQEFKDAMYTNGNGTYLFPARAFKSSAVEACRQIDGISMTAVKQMFFVSGIDDVEWVKIESDEPIMREDVVKIGMGTTDLRYRPEFKNWKTKIRVQYLEDVISPEQIVNIFELAGFCSGIGEDRPNKQGHTFGMFKVGEYEATN